MRLVENRDSANRQQYDALRRNARAPSHQGVPQFMQHNAAKHNADQSEDPQGGAGILRNAFGAQHKDQQEQKRQMNANFNSEETTYRDRPTAHRHSCKYSIHLDSVWPDIDAKRAIGRAETVETRAA